MSTGWLTWATLMLASLPAAPGDDVVQINQRGFQIPIRVMPERQHEVRELLLYLSRDQGKTWEIYSRATPDRKGFDFYTKDDGLYYFSIAVIDRTGKQDPKDIYGSKVGQKIRIDTIKPAVKLAALERAGDEVQVQWTIQEDSPDRESVKLEYKVGEGAGPWTPLGIEFGTSGQQRFKPGQPGAVKVRLTMRDLAGNEGSDEKSLAGTAGSAAAPPVPVDGAAKRDEALRLTGGAGSAPPLPGGVTPPPTPPLPGGTMDSQPKEKDIVTPPTTPLATSERVTPPAVPGSRDVPPPSVAPAGRGVMPAPQVVNKEKVKLGFDVSLCGPSGLGTVDVYMTSDDGTTWEKVTGEVSVAAASGTNAPLRGTVTVTLPREEQVYGFYLVGKNKANIGKGPPVSGTLPQVRLERDTTPPIAELYEPGVADTGRRDSLVLKWKAQDRNLGSAPVKLEWSESPEGQWKLIGEAHHPSNGMPVGTYVWQVQPNTPPRVYLRLSVRDTAGNLAIAETAKPILIDPTPPEVDNVLVLPTGR